MDLGPRTQLVQKQGDRPRATSDYCRLGQGLRVVDLDVIPVRVLDEYLSDMVGAQLGRVMSIHIGPFDMHRI